MYFSLSHVISCNNTTCGNLLVLATIKKIVDCLVTWIVGLWSYKQTNSYELSRVNKIAYAAILSHQQSWFLSINKQIVNPNHKICVHVSVT